MRSEYRRDTEILLVVCAAMVFGTGFAVYTDICRNKGKSTADDNNDDDGGGSVSQKHGIP